MPEDTVSSSLALGSGVHAAIELWFNQRMAGNQSPSHDELLAAFWDCWQAKAEDAEICFGAKEDANTIGRLADRVLQTFRESAVARIEGQIVGVEEELRGAIAAELPDLLARIDLIVETTDALTVIDFKTSRSRWSSDQAESAGEQLLLYSELARGLSPTKQLRLQFAVITKTKLPSLQILDVALDPQRVQRTKQVVGHVWQAIQARHFYRSPSPMACGSCPFTSSCRAWSG